LSYLSPADFEEDFIACYHWGSSIHQAEAWQFWAHTTISASSMLALYWAWWPYIK
jgi:hypothetical protein